MAPPVAATADGFEVQMQTNHLSHFLLAALLLPALAHAARRCETPDDEATLPRIVLHTSFMRHAPAKPLQRRLLERGAAGDFGGDGTGERYGRYQQSKLANALFASALQVR
jgi:NAD(P)-dependent dehydrogenase (short-subunit alcohol dehydrogenase family)